jgi:hypothetical protein
MKKKPLSRVSNWIVTATVLMSVLPWVANAGGGSSGGGKAVVCRDPIDDSISRAWLLDLYEAAPRWKWQLKPQTGNLTTEYARYLLELRRVIGDPRPFGEVEDRDLGSKIKNLRFTPDAIPVTSDLGQTVDLPKGCFIEQAVTYLDDSHEIIADPWIWQALDPQNQAALLAHEELYFMHRQGGEKTSESVRKLVSQLFSTTPPIALAQSLPSEYLMCWAGDETISHDDSQIFVYPDPMDPKKSVIQFNKLMGRPVFSPTTIIVPYQLDATSFRHRYREGFAWPIVYVAEGKGRFWDTLAIKEGVFKDYQINVRFEEGNPFELVLLENSRAYPKRSVATFCSKKNK